SSSAGNQDKVLVTIQIRPIDSTCDVLRVQLSKPSNHPHSPWLIYPGNTPRPVTSTIRSQVQMH
ncbi:hypothetical protein FIBSPDRAFT_862129, partial [Athelia psychrophila]